MAQDGIGASVKRREDARFLKGIGKYTDDMVFPRQTTCYFLRSTIAHGKTQQGRHGGGLQDAGRGRDPDGG